MIPLKGGDLKPCPGSQAPAEGLHQSGCWSPLKISYSRLVACWSLLKPLIQDKHQNQSLKTRDGMLKTSPQGEENGRERVGGKHEQHQVEEGAGDESLLDENNVDYETSYMVQVNI